MIRASGMVSATFVGLFTIGTAIAQEHGLERVRSESVRLRQLPLAAPEVIRPESLHRELRDWIESLLPQSRAALDAQLASLEFRVNADLTRVGAIAPGNLMQGDGRGFVSPVQFTQPPEDRDKLAVTAGVNVPCGSDDAVYVYDFSRGAPQRVLESHGTRDHDESVLDLALSKPDVLGNQLILTLRYAVQCGSSWNELAYDLFRLQPATSGAVSVLSDEHGIWFGGGQPQFRVEADDLLMEFRDRSIAGGIHNRTHVLHYTAKNGSPAVRVDPVALQPQDFVDEWITRPWSEMESRSAGDEKLQKWHELIAGAYGDFTLSQPCKDPPGQWQIGLDLGILGEHQLPEPLSVLFLVRQREQNRFTMVGISFNRQDGCPGESGPVMDSPSLFPTVGRQ